MAAPKNLGGNGFKNFSGFNKTLLVKQCWRLISNLDSLWGKVLKALYFPWGDFLRASRGGRPSWVWTSL